MLRRLLLASVAAVGLTLSGTGCINQYAPDPVTRMDQHLNESENLRSIQMFWRRFWFNEMPNHMVPERVHGGIM